MKKYILFLLIFYSVVLFGEDPVGNYYWVQFNTKANTPYSISSPEYYLSQRAIERRQRQNIPIDSTDLPVNPEFIDSLISLGFYVKHTSRWMNGAIAILDTSIAIENILKPSFVSFYQLRKDIPLKSASTKFSDIDTMQIQYYGNSYTQLAMVHGDQLQQFSKGKGVQIAIIDAGFSNSNQLPVFDSIYQRNGVLGTYDFVNPGNDVYKEHYHGNAVFSIMAGNAPGSLIGSAPDASYWLLRSEDASTEYPVEEDYWIIAAEFADEKGCDVINTSLGYTTFDNPAFNHTYDQFDGKTLRISKAANLAVEKGIVVVCSAGNSGNDSWGHVAAPSEAEDVLSVAAVDANGQVTAFSSRGFTGKWAIPKPDIAAMGAGVSYSSNTGAFVTGNGTSFSSPIIAGMAACLVSYYPEKTSFEIIDLIKTLGDLYPYCNAEYGYGIPNFSKVLNISNPDSIETVVNQITNISSFVYPNPFTTKLYVENNDDFSTLEIYSLQGTKLIVAQLESNNTEISAPKLSGLKKGVYFAVLKGEQKIHSFKLIKQ